LRSDFKFQPELSKEANCQLSSTNSQKGDFTRGSLDLELLGRIDPNLRFAFVHLDPAMILTWLASIPDSIGDLLTGDAGGIQPVNTWLG
jgi:hypothetical protein